MADMKILIVDDSSTMRRILRQSLNRCGFNDITEAGDGAEALAKCNEAKFDCILTDWNMPNMDGLEFTIAVRQKPEYAKVPIMMVTTEGGKTDVIEALTKGVNSYIVKPFTVEVLQAKIKELFPGT